MLRVPHVTLHHPTDLDLALETLAAAPGARVIAGGTDLVPTLKYGLCRPEALVAVSALPLGGIESTDTGWRVGAGTTLWELERWAAPGALGVVPRAAALVAVPPIRSRATLGGNLCLDTRCVFLNQTAFWRSGRPACFKAGGAVCHVVRGGEKCHACHQSDLAPTLIALGAAVVLRTASGERTLPLEDLYTGRGKMPLALHPGELLCAVELPGPGVPAGAAYQKLRVRKGMDFPAVAAAVYLEQAPDGVCNKARVVLGAVAPVPLRVAEAEALLEGSTLEPAVLGAAAAACVAAARPVKNVDLTPGYRKKMAGVLFQRAALEAWDGC